MAQRSPAPQLVSEILRLVAATADAATTESLAGLQGSLTEPAATPEELVSNVCELSAIEGSLGWLAAMFNAAACDVATLPDEIAHATRDTVVTTAHQGVGAIDTDGRLSGTWQSVIGAEYADWLVLPTKGMGRVLVPRDAARIAPRRDPAALSAAGVCDVTITDYGVRDGHAFTGDSRAAAIAMAGAAAAITGSAEGVWRHHVEQMRARLATTYSADELSIAAPAHVARAASDIDATKLQITEALRRPDAEANGSWVYEQAVARARAAADRLFGNSRHALDLNDPATRLWRDVHAGCRLADAVFIAGGWPAEA